MDGCSIECAFVSVVLPMCRNIIVTVATLRAIFSWNEYIFSYTFVNTKKMMTVVLGLSSLGTDVCSNHSDRDPDVIYLCISWKIYAGRIK